MLRERWALAKAHAHVVALRPSVRLGRAFAEALIADERVLFGSNSVQLRDIHSANGEEGGGDAAGAGEGGEGGGEGGEGGGGAGVRRKRRSSFFSYVQRHRLTISPDTVPSAAQVVVVVPCEEANEDEDDDDA